MRDFVCTFQYPTLIFLTFSSAPSSTSLNWWSGFPHCTASQLSSVGVVPRALYQMQWVEKLMEIHKQPLQGRCSLCFQRLGLLYGWCHFEAGAYFLKCFVPGLRKSNEWCKAGHHSVNALVQENVQWPVAPGPRIQRRLGRELELRLGDMMDGTRWTLTGEEDDSVAVRLSGEILNTEFFPVTRGCARKKAFQSAHMSKCKHFKSYEVRELKKMAFTL